jgi:hypothetical protein
MPTDADPNAVDAEVVVVVDGAAPNAPAAGFGATGVAFGVIGVVFGAADGPFGAGAPMLSVLTRGGLPGAGAAGPNAPAEAPPNAPAEAAFVGAGGAGFGASPETTPGGSGFTTDPQERSSSVAGRSAVPSTRVRTPASDAGVGATESVSGVSRTEEADGRPSELSSSTGRISEGTSSSKVLMDRLASNHRTASMAGSGTSRHDPPRVE